jgi:hypothetical protein
MVNTKKTQDMTPNERLESLLASDATTHSEVADALLDAIRSIDGWFGDALECDPETEVTRKVMAELCLFLVPADPDAEIDDLAEKTLELRFVEAWGVYRAKCEHRFALRARSISKTRAQEWPPGDVTH